MIQIERFSQIEWVRTLGVPARANASGPDLRALKHLGDTHGRLKHSLNGTAYNQQSQEPWTLEGDHQPKRIGKLQAAENSQKKPVTINERRAFAITIENRAKRPRLNWFQQGNHPS